ncbi:hypothetical protein BS47DRAFT_1368642 [Hydnum rufescens UP504]|uniref:Uncharacterized protein n=1 Tax=Hydnum rufescens UP504 TaxID=1448309 RepID=A0A9P6AF13_9AGAM|nr:hypothetical protein BS47DRAFT_1368642 [Hydnum rufescens UP504]
MRLGLAVSDGLVHLGHAAAHPCSNHQNLTDWHPPVQPTAYLSSPSFLRAHGLSPLFWPSNHYQRLLWISFEIHAGQWEVGETAKFEEWKGRAGPIACRGGGRESEGGGCENKGDRENEGDCKNEGDRESERGDHESVGDGPESEKCCHESGDGGHESEERGHESEERGCESRVGDRENHVRNAHVN